MRALSWRWNGQSQACCFKVAALLRAGFLVFVGPDQIQLCVNRKDRFHTFLQMDFSGLSHASMGCMR